MQLLEKKKLFLSARFKKLSVEVKSRAYDNILQPEDTVDHKKRLALIRMANEYVKSHNRKENVRFDIVTIVSNDQGAKINHLKNAYSVMSF